MIQEARVRVRLDTDDAKREIDELKRRMADVSHTMRTPSGGGSGPGGGGIGGLMGRIPGMGLVSEALGPTQSAFHDIATETIGPWANQLKNWAADGMDANARAARAAREQTIQAFGPHGPNEQSKAMFTQMHKQFMKNELARNAYEADPFFRGGVGSGAAGATSAAGVGAQALAPLFKSVEKGFERINKTLEDELRRTVPSYKGR